MAGFDWAINNLKNGKKVKREGWNGKDQYIELGINISFQQPNKLETVAYHEDSGSKAIVFFGTRGIQVGWLASQSDMLAEDWVEA
jgi:hypothetical protein